MCQFIAFVFCLVIDPIAVWKKPLYGIHIQIMQTDSFCLVEQCAFVWLMHNHFSQAEPMNSNNAHFFCSQIQTAVFFKNNLDIDKKN